MFGRQIFGSTSLRVDKFLNIFIRSTNVWLTNIWVDKFTGRQIFAHIYKVDKCLVDKYLGQ
jgi:hypothetical protein